MLPISSTWTSQPYDSALALNQSRTSLSWSLRASRAIPMSVGPLGRIVIEVQINSPWESNLLAPALSDSKLSRVVYVCHEPFFIDGDVGWRHVFLMHLVCCSVGTFVIKKCGMLEGVVMMFCRRRYCTL
jgi:hypothetical protein